MTTDDKTQVLGRGTPAPARAPWEPAPPSIPGYDVVRLIGKGGMGAVWEAFEYKFNRRVAIKVELRTPAMSSLAPDSLFREARIAATVDDPALVRVNDFGVTLEGHPYFAMEFVQGTDLADLIRAGPMPSGRALRFMLDISRAAAAAHEHGIVHRDLKPRNIIVDGSERARVLDFGIAVHTEGGASLAESAGSPPYMAPEHIAGKAFGPEADVYAMGVILFEMLTGERPFKAETSFELMQRIVRDPAPKVTDRIASVDADLAALVDRCLSKEPAARFRNGRQLFEELLAIAEGRPRGNLRMSMPMPQGAEKEQTSAAPEAPLATRHFRKTWNLQASPEQLWPHVSNTDRVNRAAGLAKIEASGSPSAQNGFSRDGKLRAFGLNIEWQEFPFEWISGSEHRVHRLYQNGPIRALWNHVVMAQREDGGCDLTHTVSLIPRGVLGEIAVFIEIGQSVMRGLDRVYRRVDRSIFQQSHADPFEENHPPTHEEREFVQHRADLLVHDHDFSETMVNHLKDHLLYAPTGELGRIRPSDCAAAWKTAPELTLDLLLNARNVGLLTHAWDLVCPSCRVAHESVSEISKITRTGTCESCGVHYERDLANSVEVVFRPAESARRTEVAMHCMGSPAAREHIVVQQIMKPGEVRTFSVKLPAGSYEFCSSQSSGQVPFILSPAGFTSELELSLEEKVALARPGVAMPGVVHITLRNTSEVTASMRIELSKKARTAVSAAHALLHPSFGAAADTEHVALGEYLSVAEQTFLCAHHAGLPESLTRDGDDETFASALQFEGTFENVVKAHTGRIFGRPFATGMMAAAFTNPEEGARAAIALMKAADAPLRVSIHVGRVLAFTRHESVEYFGLTIQELMSNLENLEAGELVLSGTMIAMREPRLVLAEHSLNLRMTTSKGSASAQATPRRLGIVAIAYGA
jgi:eukaryotic-like serine/threonine-protein kinase